ncbi:MAG: hypothetical protein ACXWLM_02450 [Myxococcales bacterium]
MRAAILALLLSAGALAEGSVSTAEFDTWVKLMNAQQKEEAREFFSGRDPKKIASAKAEYEKALSASGWSREKFDEVGSSLREIEQLLDEGEGSCEQLKEKDAATVALVQKRRAEMDTQAARQRAEKEVQDERRQAAAGRAPSQAELQGKWKFDLDATVANMQETMGLPAESMAKMKQTLATSMGDSTWVFSGSTVETRTVKAGAAPEVNKATYRLDGNDLYIKSASGKRESKIQVGLKGPGELLFSMMGVGSIYRKQ